MNKWIIELTLERPLLHLVYIELGQETLSSCLHLLFDQKQTAYSALDVQRQTAVTAHLKNKQLLLKIFK